MVASEQNLYGISFSNYIYATLKKKMSGNVDSFKGVKHLYNAHLSAFITPIHPLIEFAGGSSNPLFTSTSSRSS